MTKITAKLNHLRMSPRKVRLVADLVKGLSAAKAEQQLIFLPKRAAQPLLKLLRSAIANAEHNFGIKKETLKVENILVDGGPALKRWRARAMGRAAPILKRTSRVTLILAPLQSPKATSAGQAEAKSKVKPVKEKESRSIALPADSGNLQDDLDQAPLRQGSEGQAKKQTKPQPQKPYRTTSQSKKRFFSRQPLSNARKLFRRKSI